MYNNVTLNYNVLQEQNTWRLDTIRYVPGIIDCGLCKDLAIFRFCSIMYQYKSKESKEKTSTKQVLNRVQKQGELTGHTCEFKCGHLSISE